MCTQRGASLPISASLQTQCAERAVRKALLWAAGNDYYSGFEIEAVAEVLMRAGVEVERRNGVGTTAIDFLDAYSNLAFDLVWVAGHGEIDHWHDGSSQLVVGDACSLGIDELKLATPEAGQCRLAVLNVCDGGVASVNGGIQKLGLAPMLARASQSTISHLWPVNPLLASAFGALLANEIAKGVGLHRSFDLALTALRSTSEGLASAVRDIVPGQPLVERLERLELNTQSILHWGSPCFFA